MFLLGRVWKTSGSSNPRLPPPRAQQGRARVSSPPGGDTVPMGSWSCVPRAPQVRLGAGRPTRPTPAPCRRARESPLSQPGWDGAPCAPIPSRHSKPRTAASEVWGGGSRGCWDSRGLSGSRGPLRGRLPAPRALRVGASHGSERGAPAAPTGACSAARRPGPDPAERRRRAPEEGWGRGVGGGARDRVPAAGSAGERASLETLRLLRQSQGSARPAARGPPRGDPARARLNARVTQPESPPPGGGGRQVDWGGEGGGGGNRPPSSPRPRAGPRGAPARGCQRRSWEGAPRGDLAEKPREGAVCAATPDPGRLPRQAASPSCLSGTEGCAESCRKRRGPVRAPQNSRQVPAPSPSLALFSFVK